MLIRVNCASHTGLGLAYYVTYYNNKYVFLNNYKELDLFIKSNKKIYFACKTNIIIIKKNITKTKFKIKGFSWRFQFWRKKKISNFYDRIFFRLGFSFTIYKIVHNYNMKYYKAKTRRRKKWYSFMLISSELNKFRITLNILHKIRPTFRYKDIGIRTFKPKLKKKKKVFY